jgi:hypothetical protein
VPRTVTDGGRQAWPGEPLARSGPAALPAPRGHFLFAHATLACLRIGDSRVTMRLTREGDRTVAQLLDVTGPVHVAIELH